MQNSPEEVKEALIWMVGRPPQITQQWIFEVLQQLMEDKGLSMDAIKTLIPVIGDQEILQGNKIPEDPLAQAFLDSLVEHLKEMQASGEY